jgi:hypothetical protein
MDTIATIGTLGTLVLFLHLRLERRMDRLENRVDRLEDKLGSELRVVADKFDRHLEWHIQVAGGGPAPG